MSQVQLVMTREDARRSLEKLQKENDVVQEEVQKNIKLFYQRQKEHLLRRHDQLTEFNDDRQLKINQAKQMTPDVVKKRFDHLYPIVEDIYTKKLLLMELREELYHVQTQQEIREIQQVLQATDLRLESSQETSTMHADSPVAAWHRYMVAFVKENARITKERHLKSSCILRNAVFYHVRYRIDTESSLAIEELSFSTRHRGICIFICIQATRSSEGVSSLILTSDLPLNDAQSPCQEYLENRRNPVDFVMEVIWTNIEHHLLHLM